MAMLSRCLAAASLLAGLLLPLSGQAGTDLVLGQSAPLSGPFASLGQDYRNGALLAFDEANQGGGVHGRKIRLVTVDDAYQVDKAVANAHALIEEHEVLCFFNHMFTNTVLATLPIASKAAIPFFGPYTGHPDLYRNDRPLLFVTRASFASELDKILTYIATVGYRRVALVHYDNPIGLELMQDVKAGLVTRNVSLVTSAGMPVGGKAEAAAHAIARSEPDAVILGVSGGDAVGFIKAQAAAGKRPVYFARSLVGSKQLHAELGPLAAGVVISQLVPSPFKANAPVARDYRRLLARRDPRAQPSFVELEGFINARLMLIALHKAGPGVTRQSLASALSTLGRVDLGGYVVEFDEHDHVGSRFVELTMLRQDGSFSQ
jgi:branched-chain amino acid transport system substrate-binding protein